MVQKRFRRNYQRSNRKEPFGRGYGIQRRFSSISLYIILNFDITNMDNHRDDFTDETGQSLLCSKSKAGVIGVLIKKPVDVLHPHALLPLVVLHAHANILQTLPEKFLPPLSNTSYKVYGMDTRLETRQWFGREIMTKAGDRK